MFTEIKKNLALIGQVNSTIAMNLENPNIILTIDLSGNYVANQIDDNSALLLSVSRSLANKPENSQKIRLMSTLKMYSIMFFSILKDHERLDEYERSNQPEFLAIQQLINHVVDYSQNEERADFLLETTFIDQLQLAWDRYFELPADQRGQNKKMINLLQNTIKLIQLPLVATEYTIKSTLEKLFYLLRHPSTIFENDNHISDEHNDLNIIQYSIKDIWIDIKYNIEKIFQLITHPLDSLKSIIDDVINFVTSDNKIDTLTTYFKNLVNNFVKHPLQYSIEIVSLAFLFRYFLTPAPKLAAHLHAMPPAQVAVPAADLAVAGPLEIMFNNLALNTNFNGNNNALSATRYEDLSDEEKLHRREKLVVSNLLICNKQKNPQNYAKLEQALIQFQQDRSLLAGDADKNLLEEHFRLRKSLLEQNLKTLKLFNNSKNNGTIALIEKELTEVDQRISEVLNPIPSTNDPDIIIEVDSEPNPLIRSWVLSKTSSNSNQHAAKIGFLQSLNRSAEEREMDEIVDFYSQGFNA